MNLKKSDKIIAVVAVVILIIAAIGVILYVDKEPEKVAPEVDKMLIYTVEFNEPSQSSVTPDKTAYSITDKKPYTGTFEVSCDNLKDVDIFVEYKDNDRGLFKSSRKNTIKVTVFDEDENEIYSKQIKSPGNETLNIPGSNPLNIGQITAKDLNDAEEKLTENLSKSNTGLTKTYKIVISVKYGEIRIIRKNLERLSGDSFTLEITENHYAYQLVEQGQYDDGNDDISEESLNSMVPTYRTLGYPGFH